jgi:hypothetical protein
MIKNNFDFRKIVSYLKIKSYTFLTDSMSENFFKDGVVCHPI